MLWTLAIGVLVVGEVNVVASGPRVETVSISMLHVSAAAAC